MKLVQLPVSKVILDTDLIAMIGKTGFDEYHIVLREAAAMPKVTSVDLKVLLEVIDFKVLVAPEEPKVALAKA